MVDEIEVKIRMWKVKWKMEEVVSVLEKEEV